MPLMISRLMLSLKKASRDKQNGWMSNALSGAHARTGTHMEFGLPSKGPEDSVDAGSDEVPPPDLARGRDEEISNEDHV